MRGSRIAALKWYTDGGVTPSWWLAGGLIPESTDYTIYDPIAASDLAGSYENKANPGTRDATVGVAPTHAQGSGWTFNGTTQYLNTSKPFLSGETVVVWCDKWTGVYVCGNTKMQIRPINSPNTRLTIQTNVDLLGKSTSSILAIGASRSPYRNNKKHSASMASFPAGTDYDVYIGCRNNAETALNFGGGQVFRYAHYNIALSDNQIEALFDTMRDYQLPSVNSYSSQVLALNPICYYPLNQKYGGYVLDISGNKANAVANYINVGQDGLNGYAAQGTGSGTQSIETLDDWGSVTGINLNSFSFSCLIKNVNADVQARPCNIYSGTGTEYWALEIRSGNIAVYSRENGVTEDTGAIVVATDNTWQHLVGYNDLASGKIGIYLDGVNYEFNKGTTGFSDTSPDQTYPYTCQSMTGLMQHIAFFDHKLSQSEVNSLLP